MKAGTQNISKRRRGQVLVHLIKSIGARNIAEIGISKGGDALYVLRANLKENFLDRFQLIDHNFQPTIPVYLNEHGMIPPAEYIIKPSNEACRDVPDDSLDLCYIDADHRYESIKEDCRSWEQKVRAGGILAGHDYDHPSHIGIKRAIDELYEGRISLHETKNCHIWSIRV